MNKKIPLKVFNIIYKLKSFNYKAFIVGGCVRDLLYGFTPKDFDISTNASTKDIKRIFPKSKEVGAKFGVTLVNGIEIATFRKDIGVLNGRHPKNVTFLSNEKEDCLRRDFTINGFLLDLHPGSYTIIDYIKGTIDINKKILRFIGKAEDRIKEDHLRMLRAVRFASKYSLKIEKRTLTAIRKNAYLIKKISKERIFSELEKMFLNENRHNTLLLLKKTNLLQHILPEIFKMIGVEQPKNYHPEGDVFTHTYLALKKLPKKVSIYLALATLLHDCGKLYTFKRNKQGKPTFHGHDEVGAKKAEKILERLKVSNDIKIKVTELVAGHMLFRFAKEMKKSKLIKISEKETFKDSLILHKADCLSSNKNLKNYYFVKNFVKSHKNIPNIERRKRILNGDDLIILGFIPGPLFKEILSKADEQILEGKIVTKEAALEFAKSYKGENNGNTDNSKNP